jgi:hypothetical protein
LSGTSAARLKLEKQSPDLAHVVKLAREFEVSKQAMSRVYAEWHEELVAIVVIHNDRIQRPYRNRTRFPFIRLSTGDPIPRGSTFHCGSVQRDVPGEFRECVPDNWIEVKRGEPAPTLLEQVYHQRDGYALILLHLIEPDDDEQADERDLERNWQPKFAHSR